MVVEELPVGVEELPVGAKQLPVGVTGLPVGVGKLLAELLLVDLARHDA